MSLKKVYHSRVTVTEMEEFLEKPPAGFSVEKRNLGSGSGYVVCSDPKKVLVFIDHFEDCNRIIFNNSLGRTFKMRNLGEYTDMRNRLLSSKIYLLVSACEGNVSSKQKAATETRVLKQFMVCVNGSDSLVQWHMAKGLDKTISSVAGESYKLKIDLTDAVESWAAKNNLLTTGGLKKHKIVWRDVFFTLKYSSDALFDFPKMFGCSKRTFKVLTGIRDGLVTCPECTPAFHLRETWDRLQQIPVTLIQEKAVIEHDWMDYRDRMCAIVKSNDCRLSH